MSDMNKQIMDLLSNMNTESGSPDLAKLLEMVKDNPQLEQILKILQK